MLSHFQVVTILSSPRKSARALIPGSLPYFLIEGRFVQASIAASNNGHMIETVQHMVDGQDIELWCGDGIMNGVTLVCWRERDVG